jgi:hypothetical protein
MHTSNVSSVGCSVRWHAVRKLDGLNTAAAAKQVDRMPQEWVSSMQLLQSCICN